MKNFKIILILALALIGYTSCEKDELEFVAQEPGAFTFTNSFLDEYILAQGTSSNVGERFTWSSPDFGAPTAITYELQSSLTGDFSDVETVGSTSGNELAVTIGQLMTMASNLGLDGDPNSPEPNMGQVTFRLRAFAGNEAIEEFSNAQVLNITILESTGGGGSGIEPASWGVVGSGYNDWGNAGPDGVFYTTDQANVIVAYVNLIDGAIKFRENNDWTNNLGDDGADGTLEANGADISVTAGSYKITIDTSANTYTMEPYTWGVVGSAYNDWGSAGPDAKFYYDYTTDTFKVGVQLMDGAFKFRFNNDWVENFGDTGADGTLDAGGDDIIVSAGYYNITIDFNAGTYTLEAGDVWGIVGSGYNDWGNAGPDFSFTQVNPDIYVAEIVDLIDGFIKFRVNNDWGTNNGDTGADGTLYAGGDDIAVTAGKYRVQFDLANGTYMLNKIQ
jgi:hypothetical protein